jgi:hypothetical protein
VSKKSKKTNTPKGKSGGSGSSTKDSITGMPLIFTDAGNIKTDTIYEANANINSLLLSAESQEFRDSLTSFESELEISPEFLVVTYRLQSTSPNSPQETTARVVMQGQYKYAKDRLQYARIDAIAQDSYSVQNGKHYSYGNVRSFNGGISINSPSSLSSFLIAYNEQQGQEVAIYDYLPPGSVGYNGMANETSDYIVVGDRSSVTSFGSNRFLQVGWHSNPFAPNLI